MNFQRMNELFKNPAEDKILRRIYFFILLLLVPALLVNLGLLALIDDEGIRSLVALEMKISGNYITPTLAGDLYYNKPPLYNWILLSFFELTGTVSEFIARLPTVIFLLGYAATVFYFFKKEIGTRAAFLNSLALITCGRIFFYDSMLGLIDICFSWIVFTLFMLVFFEYKKGRLLRLFVLTYLLTAAGFLMKGLPALVFQAFTLTAFFIYKKDFKKLFTWQHLAGGLIFLLLTGGYYFLYQQQNSLETVFSTLFTESSKRTAVNYGWQATLLHLFTFPFEMVYHFLPWSVLVIYFFKKESLRLVLKNEFLTYCALIFLVNISVYWASVEVYPRYLLMFPPLIFGIFWHLHFQYFEKNTWQRSSLEILFLVICTALTLLSLLPFFWERAAAVENSSLKATLIFLAAALCTGFYYRLKNYRWEILMLFLLVFRLGFDWFVLPDRNGEDWGDEVRKSSIEIGESSKNKSLFLLQNSDIQPANAFYLTRARMKKLERQFENFQPGAWYIADPGLAEQLDGFEKIGEMKVRHGQPKHRDILIYRPD
ncbi:MAG TPA: hypothetical protein PKC40_02420 [Saprospiraceae bacterium]|nr:hypothetical protein [Saprospiraceae bacterium]